MVYVTMENRDEFKVYFELADLSGDKVVTRLPLMRLCVALESKLPRVPESQLQQIDDLCAIAIKDENCFFMSDDTWLIITISLKDPERFLGDPKIPFSIDELTKMIRNGDITAQTNIERSLHITIRRNVLPSEGIWKELQESHHCSHWAKEFYSRWSYQESLRKPESPMEKVKKPMKQQCELEISQQLGDVPDAAPSSSQESQLSSKRPANRKPVLHAVNATEIVMVRKLGNGARGIVWQVVWGNCTYAMKIFEDKEGAYAIEKDYAESGLVLDPHIVQVFGHSCYVLRSIYYKKQGWGKEDHPRPSLLMELMDATLENVIYQSSKRTSPPIPPVKKLDLLSQIASAMQKLHDNNVVHGDLKLGNILVSKYEVTRDAQHFLAKVADFDGARRIKTSASSVEEPFVGTTQYAAPEVLKRCRPPYIKEVKVDIKSDVYSFGVVAFEILAEDWAWGFNGADLKASAEHPHTDKQYKVREVADGKRKLIDCEAWSSVRYRYREEVISLVESCLEINPVKRPEFKEICEKLSTAKSNHQDLERKTAARFKFVNFVCLFVVAGLILSCFFHYASAALITVVVVATSACLTEKWICSDNLIFAFPAQTFRNMYSTER